MSADGASTNSRSTEPPGPPDWVVWAVLVAIVVVGCVVRMPGLEHSLWMDELAAAWAVRDGFSDIASRAWMNNLSPLYFYGLAASTAVFGYHEEALRYPSLAAGLLTVPAVFGLCLLLLRSRGLALVASGLAALDSTLVHYSLEVRPYAFAQLFSVVQVGLFVGLGRRPSWVRICALGTCTALLIGLQYFSALLVLAECAYLLLIAWRDRGRSVPVVWSFALSQLCAIVLLIPLLPHMGYLFENRSALGWARQVGWSDIFTRFHFARYLLAPAATALLLEFGVRNRSSRAAPTGPVNPRVDVLLACWWLIPSAFVFVVTWLEIAGLNADRYAIVASVVPILGCARLMRLFATRAARIAVPAVAVFLVHIVPSQGGSPVVGGFRVEEDWRATVDWINANKSDLLPVLVDPGLVEQSWLEGPDPDPLLREYLLSAVNSLYRLELRDGSAPAQPVRLGPRGPVLEPHVIRTLLRHGGTWLVVRGQGSRLARAILERFHREGARGWIVVERQFEGVYAAKLALTR